MSEAVEKKFTVNSLKYYTQKNRDKNRELNDARYLKLADKGALATKDEVAKADLAAALKTEIEGKADASTTLAGYGITNAFTKDEVNAKISSTYKPKGTLAAAGLVPGLLIEANLGNVYNISDALTTDANFIDGSGKTFPAGVNVAVIEAAAAAYTVTEDTTAQEGTTYYGDANGTALTEQPAAGTDISSAGYYVLSPATYKFDVLAGMVDTSSFLTEANFQSFTNAEIDDIFDEITDTETQQSGD